MKPRNFFLQSWKIIETEFIPRYQHHYETIFTHGNGYLSSRGSFEERYPSDKQATLIHGMWDDAPIVFTELVNAPDWTSVELWINGKEFRLDQGLIHQYERYLDLRSGLLIREVTWSYSEADPIVNITFQRFASLDDHHILASKITITPINSTIELRVRCSINSQVENDGLIHWDILNQSSTTECIALEVQTRKTLKTLAMSSTFALSDPDTTIMISDCKGHPGIEFSKEIEVTESLSIEKYVGVATSRDTECPLELANIKSKDALKCGFYQLKDKNIQAWNKFWEFSDILIVGDDEANTAIRHALYQLRIAAPAKDEKVSIGAKTLSGFGYRGHVFWDTEIFILPFFTITQPELSKNMLLYRWHTLPGARKKAMKNGYSGAQYPWESAETGEEVTPTWVPDHDNPLKLIRIWTGDIEIHITADIAYALNQYWQWTGDDEFWINYGAPIILETALFWAERAQPDVDYYSFRGVIGPDEYHEHVDNNPFTNYMAKWHLETAIDVFTWLQENSAEEADRIIQSLDLTADIIQKWKSISEKILILQDTESGLFEQFEGYFNLEDIDLSLYKERETSIQNILGIEQTNHTQVIKQADIIMLLCLFRNRFNHNTWRKNWDYYHPRTDHEFGSSLGPSFYAWAACEMGKPNLAYEHFMRAAGSDLYNLRGNTDQGIHAASSGGLWQAIVFGFAGLNLRNNALSVKPRLPSHWERIRFRVIYQGTCFEVDIDQNKAELSKLLTSN